jgi:hypothetical protein
MGGHSPLVSVAKTQADGWIYPSACVFAIVLFGATKRLRLRDLRKKRTLPINLPHHDIQRPHDRRYICDEAPAA